MIDYLLNYLVHTFWVFFLCVFFFFSLLLIKLHEMFLRVFNCYSLIVFYFSLLWNGAVTVTRENLVSCASTVMKNRILVIFEFETEL